MCIRDRFLYHRNRPVVSPLELSVGYTDSHRLELCKNAVSEATATVAGALARAAGDGRVGRALLQVKAGAQEIERLALDFDAMDARIEQIADQIWHDEERKYQLVKAYLEAPSDEARARIEGELQGVDIFVYGNEACKYWLPLRHAEWWESLRWWVEAIWMTGKSSTDTDVCLYNPLSWIAAARNAPVAAPKGP